MKEKQKQTEQQMTMCAIKMLFSMLSSPCHPPRHETDLWQNQDILSSCQNNKIKRYWVENTGLPQAKLSGKQHRIPSSFGLKKANVLTFLPSPYIRGNFKSSSSIVLYALWGKDKQHLQSLHSISDPVPWNKQMWFKINPTKQKNKTHYFSWGLCLWTKM